MQIADLPYLQNVSEDELILGSAGVSVTSEAFAFGSETSLYVSANSTATSWSNDDTAYGTGLAGAFGDNATANLTVASDGNIAIRKSKFKSSRKTAVASGFVSANDLPSNLTFYGWLESLF